MSLTQSRMLKTLASQMAIRDRVAEDISGVVGGTPLIRLNRMNKGIGGKVSVKLEYMNPGKSIKDRLGMALIHDAELRGEISPGKTTLVEATSGNTGIALAMLGASKGYDVVLTMPETMSLERRINLAIFGAQVILTPAADGLTGARYRAEQIVSDINQRSSKTGNNAFLTEQFKSPSNAEIHRISTAPEIEEALNGNVDAFVMGVGTGGTITGVAQYFSERCAKGKTCPKIIAVEPAESAAITHLLQRQSFTPKPHKIQGIGAGFIPELVEPKTFNSIIRVDSEASIHYAKRLALEEGILCGISAGAIVKAALDLADQEEYQNKEIVAVIPSHGERYLSTGLYSSLALKCATMPIEPVPLREIEKILHKRPKPSKRIPSKSSYLLSRANRKKALHSIAESIGNTSMVKIHKVCGPNARVTIKLETDNPSKAGTDRAAYAMILDAERGNLINEHTNIVTASTGNLGISMAMVCASRGYPLTVFVPENETVEKRVCIAAYGAKVKLTPRGGGITAAVELAERYARNDPLCLHVNQFDSDGAWKVHYDTTAPEIFQTVPDVDYLVLPCGNGSVIEGLTRYVKDKNLKCSIVAVESTSNPVLTAASEGNLPRKVGEQIDGLDIPFYSYETTHIDKIASVTPEDATSMIYKLASEEGLFCGPSTGACVHAARKLVAESGSPSPVIVTLSSDYGDRFLSHKVFEVLKEECNTLPVIQGKESGPSAEHVWFELSEEAKKARKASPGLEGFFNSRILHQPSFAGAIAECIAPALQKVAGIDLVKSTILFLTNNPQIMDDIAVDCWRYSVIDAALQKSEFQFLTQFLFYKGFHAIICHRIAHQHWNTGDQWTALLMQSLSSSAYAVDIHPQATLGRGITVDHATGLVIGGTAVVGKNVQFLHDITLGATGKVSGDRHPKIGDDCILGTHCQILGNIRIGNGCVVAASAVVNRPVDPYCTVAGIPAKVVKRSPVKEMAVFDPTI
eukprot:TRINITY_DN2189_c1_g1_i1.p1 TRINITY_DN2189_c1_g1~~TRINITY_DN2189_c1_g1_i1.p1  ORF type:complete len:1000 (+),score=180.02 TRINITY_DN2189_c1_g1_i1:78-3002(+)